MKANELRIGNLIKGHYDDKSDIVKVIGYDPWENFIWVEGSLNAEFYEEFSPIPLIEEWLVKFGFELHFGKYCKGNFCYYPDLKMFQWRGLPLLDSLWNKVHKLQNLYFALTGQELTIK
jgi:hypothetical protein